MTHHHLLIADDEENVRTFLSQYFSRMGYRTTTASNGEKALRILEGINPDLILADYRMPNMDGVAFLSRAQEIRPDAMRILLTAYGDLKVAMAAINQANVYRFIPKPWDNHDLLLTVQRALEHHDLILESRAFVATLEMTVEENVQELGRLREVLREVTRKMRDSLP